MARTLILVIAVVFVAGFAALTLAEVAKRGPDILTVLSLLILAMLGFGIIGALRGPPDA